MVYRDTENQLTHLTIVYAGAPEAGKTKTVRMLSQELREDLTVKSPEEYLGRTLYFDWLEYTGGYFMGGQLRCRILTVPGQGDLYRRRRKLLEQADVVVFVANSSAESITQSRTYLDEVREIISHFQYPPAVLLQCNKQDLPDALPVDTLREQLDIDTDKAFTSVATEKKGVRQCFLMAVRAAVERAQRMLDNGEPLDEGGPVEDSDKLLQTLRQDEPASPFADEDGHGTEIHAADAPTATNETPGGAVESNGGTTVTASLDLPMGMSRGRALSAMQSDGGDSSGVATAQTVARVAIDAPLPTMISRLVWPAEPGLDLTHHYSEAQPPIERLPSAANEWLANIAGGLLYTHTGLRFRDEYEAKQKVFNIGRLFVHVEDKFCRNRCFFYSRDLHATDDTAAMFQVWEMVAPATRHQQPLMAAWQQADEPEQSRILNELKILAREATQVMGMAPVTLDELVIAEGGSIDMIRPVLPLLGGQGDTPEQWQPVLEKWRDALLQPVNS